MSSALIAEIVRRPKGRSVRPWREHMTPEEREAERLDAARRAVTQAMMVLRNRATQRAGYRVRVGLPPAEGHHRRGRRADG